MRNLVLGLVAALACAAPASAQDYPTKPVRMLVGFPPGGATDLVARILQPRLAEAFRQEIIVDNRPGANSVIAAELTARAAPDGYTLHLATLAALTISPAITKVPYDPFRDFTPIARLVELQNIFVVLPRMPVHNMQELAAAARAKPGAINFASSGTGSTGHLSGELFKSMAGIDMVHIPYKGGGPALADFFGGQVDVFVAIVSTVTPHVQSGKARALAVTGYKRAAALPDVPTVAESGFPGFESTNWYCLVGPPNLPRPIVDRWNREVTAVLGEPAIRQGLVDRGIDPAPSSPAELAAYLRSESDKWARVAKATGLQAH
jgi:tripartite-type tricarboxylate transporter receptor subunit TctC